MDKATKKFILNIVEDSFRELSHSIKCAFPEAKKKGSEAYKTLSSVITSAVNSIEKWVNDNALRTEDTIEIMSVPKVPKDKTVKVSKEKFAILKDAYTDWLAAQEFLDRCQVPQISSKSNVNYTLIGRITELINMAGKGEISRELSEMLDYINN